MNAVETPRKGKKKRDGTSSESRYCRLLEKREYQGVVHRDVYEFIDREVLLYLSLMEWRLHVADENHRRFSRIWSGSENCETLASLEIFVPPALIKSRNYHGG